MNNENKVVQIFRRLAQIKKELEDIKPLYKEFDELISELVGMNEMCHINHHRVYKVVDNFRDKNTMFKASAFKRYDFEITTLKKVA